MTAVVHWDDAPKQRAERGHLAARWTMLGEAAGCVGVGLRRIEIDPERWSTPAHVHTAEEELFYVLGGAGLSWQNGAVFEVAAGDCLAHLPRGEPHTLRAGPDGLDVLAFGTRVPTEAGHLPRAGVSWYAGSWVESEQGEQPWAREAAAGEPEVAEPSERPARIVNVRDVDPLRHGPRRRDLGRAAGSQRTGLKHVQLAPGELSSQPHCHSAEEELFVVLDGAGELELTVSPFAREMGMKDERHPVRAGSVAARPAGSKVAHTFRAGDQGLELLAYGTREPSDIVYYPESEIVFLRGIGVRARVEDAGWA